MALLLKATQLIPGQINLNLLRPARFLSLSAVSRLKEYKEEVIKDSLVVSADYVPSPRSDQLLQQAAEAKKLGQHFCPQCTLGLDIKHTDVLILSQYLRDDGCMLPRRVTGLCKRQQRRISAMVTMAQKAGLMSNMNPPNSKRDPKKRFQWKKYNKYFEEDTIKC
ncbi:28S ribosomal protein S18a, mitochondrial-like [Uranotaenia lowii]|uniref:28S ribosomal protein S18a, mitochondrial-like n=1 Tax=Uranotaenia lowii TaxID=190385 RepID=UPI00247AB470|nr:28S ribosomal protein S18a, mitochondrial-like [Uranotaenia lowii]XP_055610835.1 28S ribosomal protein S18a, mitochondrial-like [Uranotaenia lowii]